MKRSLASVLLVLSVLLVPFLSQAQDFDLYGVPRYLVLDNGTVTSTTSSAATVSNTAVDIHGYSGVAAVVFTCVTNGSTSGTPTIYARLEGSTDRTNWTLLPNCALSTLTAINVTNFAGLGNGTNLVSTNNFLVPGTITSPTAATAGFANAYLSPAAFTSSGVAFTNSTGGTAVLGFNIADAPRYIHTIYTVNTGTNTFVTSAVLVARKSRGY